METFFKKLSYVALGALALFSLKDKSGGNATMPNCLKVVWYQLNIWAKSAYGCAARSLKDVKFFAYAAILFSTAVILTGAVVARCGYVDFGRGIMAIGAIGAGILSMYTFIRSAVLIGLLTAGSQAASGLTGGRVKKLEPDQAAAWVRGVATAGAWVTFVSLYMCVIPIYNDLVMAGVNLTCFLFMAHVLQAQWTTHKTGSRTAAIIFGTSVLVIVSAANMFPAAARSVVGWHGIASSELTQWTGRRAAVEKVKDEAAVKSRQIDTTLLRQLNAAKQSLEWKYVGGGTWSDTDKAAYDGLTASIKAVEDGTYWQKMAAARKPAMASGPQPATVPQVASASSANAAAAPPSGVSPVAVAAAAPRKVHDPAARAALCAKYPQLCGN